MLADGLARALRNDGHQVDLASDGVQADQRLVTESFDVVLLDLGLPGMAGGEVLRRLRLRGIRTPVLILSARMDIDERIRMLDSGADDYLVKPITVPELEARCRAIRRRSTGEVVQQLTIGRLHLDLAGQRAWVGPTPLELNAREWSALAFLAQRANRIVTKEQFIDSLYGDDEISPNALEKCISRLRSRLEPAGVTIRTVRGLGYYLEKPSDAESLAA